MWNLNREDDYYRIYDSNKDIAGYFDPDYGELFPKEKEQELIEQMHKNKDKIPGGFLMVPMVKFGIFEPNKEMSTIQLQKQLDSVEKTDRALLVQVSAAAKPDLPLHRMTGQAMPDKIHWRRGGRRSVSE